MFLALLGAHFFGDVLSNSSKLAELKRKGDLYSRVRATALHCCIHAAWVLIFTWPWGSKMMFLASIYIATTHFIIDFSRISIEQRLIVEKENIILKRREIICWLRGKGNDETTSFMEKNFKKWLYINIIDQSSHLLVSFVFVLYVA